MDADQALSALGKIAHALNNEKIVWGVGGTALLFLQGLLPVPERLELLAEPAGFPSAVKALGKLGVVETRPGGPHGALSATHHYTCTLGGASVSLFADMAVQRKEAAFRYPFAADRITGYIRLGDTAVPVTPLEDWYVLYLLLPGRARLAVQISRCLRANTLLADRTRFNPWLANRLPGDVREHVLALYSALK